MVGVATSNHIHTKQGPLKNHVLGARVSPSAGGSMVLSCSACQSKPSNHAHPFTASMSSRAEVSWWSKPSSRSQSAYNSSRIFQEISCCVPHALNCQLTVTSIWLHSSTAWSIMQASKHSDCCSCSRCVMTVTSLHALQVFKLPHWLLLLAGPATHLGEVFGKVKLCRSIVHSWVLLLLLLLCPIRQTACNHLPDYDTN